MTGAAEHISREVGEQMAREMSAEMSIEILLGPGPYYKQPWIERLLCWVSPYYRERHEWLKKYYETWREHKKAELMDNLPSEFKGFPGRYEDLKK